MSASKSIILTGASRGIGLAVAHFLLKQKHNLVVVARSQGPLDKLREQYGEQVRVLTGDLSDFTLGAKARDLALSAWGRLDGLVVNHGVLEPVARIADAQIDQWQKLFNINYFSFVEIIKATLPALRESKGRIVLVSSGAAVAGYTGWAPYGASKAAVNHLAMTLAAEEPEVTTVSIRPGVVDTDMQTTVRGSSSGMDKDHHNRFVQLHETGKLLKPEQPGNVISRLVLDAPKDMSGKFLSWDNETLKEFQDA